MPRDVLFLLNPGAGGGRADDRLRRLLTGRRHRVPPHRVVPVRSAEDVSEALSGVGANILPVAVGGDGTVSLVASALEKRRMQHVAISVLPLGTGNIVARMVGLPDPDACLRALTGGRRVQLDVVHTSHPRMPVSLVGISAGFEGRFIDAWARWRSRGRAPAAVAASIRAWPGRGGTTLELDGWEVLEPSERVFAAGLYNMPLYAGGVAMNPGADPFDGIGEGVVYDTSAAYLRTVVAGARRETSAPIHGVRRHPWRTARIWSDGPLQIDGEPVGRGAVTARLDPGALSLVVPEA